MPASSPIQDEAGSEAESVLETPSLPLDTAMAEAAAPQPPESPAAIPALDGAGVEAGMVLEISTELLDRVMEEQEASRPVESPAAAPGPAAIQADIEPILETPTGLSDSPLPDPVTSKPQEANLATPLPDRTVEETGTVLPDTCDFSNSPLAQPVIAQLQETPAAEPVLEAEEKTGVEGKVETVLESSADFSETVEAAAVSSQPFEPESLTEEALPDDAPVQGGSQLENEMEIETALKVAAFLADPPAADPASSEPEGACWVFKNNVPAITEKTNGNECTEKTPLILGSRILSEPCIEELPTEAAGRDFQAVGETCADDDPMTLKGLTLSQTELNPISRSGAPFSRGRLGRPAHPSL